MNVFSLTIVAVAGLACVAVAVRVLLRGKPVVTSAGRVWPTARMAGAFWLLLALALLTFPALTLGARAGVIGADAGFWLGGVPLLLAAAAVAAFRPRRP